MVRTPPQARSCTRVHSGDKLFSCHACGKAFAQSGALTTHLRVHSGDKPYSCHACGKAFATSGKLTVHLRVHSSDQPYSCDTCGKAFAHSSSLTRHVRTHKNAPQRQLRARRIVRGTKICSPDLGVGVDIRAITCHGNTLFAACENERLQQSIGDEGGSGEERRGEGRTRARGAVRARGAGRQEFAVRCEPERGWGWGWITHTTPLEKRGPAQVVGAEHTTARQAGGGRERAGGPLGFRGTCP